MLPRPRLNAFPLAVSHKGPIGTLDATRNRKRGINLYVSCIVIGSRSTGAREKPVQRQTKNSGMKPSSTQPACAWPRKSRTGKVAAEDHQQNAMARRSKNEQVADVIPHACEISKPVKREEDPEHWGRAANEAPKGAAE